MVQVEISDLPTTQFTAGAVAKSKCCTIKDAKVALDALVAQGLLTSKVASSGATNYKLPKNAANAKAAGTAKKTATPSTPSDKPDGLPADSSQEQYAAAKAEHKALKAWRDGGEKGPKPATPNLDRMHELAEANGGSMPKTRTRSTRSRSTKTTESAPRGTTVRFFIDGKPMPDSQNKLSSVAWYHTAGVCGKDSPRCSVTELRKILADIKITDPSNTEWVAELANGKTIETRAL